MEPLFIFTHQQVVWGHVGALWLDAGGDVVFFLKKKKKYSTRRTTSGLSCEFFREFRLLGFFTSSTGNPQIEQFWKYRFLYGKKQTNPKTCHGSQRQCVHPLLSLQDLIRAAIGAALYIITSLICVIRGAGDGALIAGGVSRWVIIVVMLPLCYCWALHFFV